MVDLNEAAPAWKGPDQDNKMISSADFSGKWYLLYFYPKDDTPGCTIEACGFRDAFDALGKRISIVGVSADGVESHRKFADKFKLPFSLIADEDRSIIGAFGTDGIILPKRVTFIVDPAGIIRRIYRGFDCTTHAAEIGNDLLALGV